MSRYFMARRSPRELSVCEGTQGKLVTVLSFTGDIISFNCSGNSGSVLITGSNNKRKQYLYSFDRLNFTNIQEL